MSDWVTVGGQLASPEETKALDKLIEEDKRRKACNIDTDGVCCIGDVQTCGWCEYEVGGKCKLLNIQVDDEKIACHKYFCASYGFMCFPDKDIHSHKREDKHV